MMGSLLPVWRARIAGDAISPLMDGATGAAHHIASRRQSM
jgi:hypothetical protein